MSTPRITNNNLRLSKKKGTIPQIITANYKFQQDSKSLKNFVPNRIFFSIFLLQKDFEPEPIELWHCLSTLNHHKRKKSKTLFNSLVYIFKL